MSHDIEEWLRKDIENLLLLQNYYINLRGSKPVEKMGFAYTSKTHFVLDVRSNTLVQISRHESSFEQSFHQYETDIKATLKDCDIKMHPALHP